MSSHSPRFKLGVLNMTISFDQPQSARKVHQKMESNRLKMHPIPSFIPRYRGLCQRNMTIADRKEGGFSPYLNYRHSQKAALRYYRDQLDSQKRQAVIAVCSPEKQLQSLAGEEQSFTEDTSYMPNKPIKGTQLKVTLNKRHLRPDSQIIGDQSDDHLMLNLERNPEENLKGVFTVRPVRTSIRYRKEMAEKNPKYNIREAKTRQEHRERIPRRKEKVEVIDNVEYKEKRIRPWSPLRNIYNKEMMQSDLMEPNLPHA